MNLFKIISLTIGSIILSFLLFYYILNLDFWISLIISIVGSIVNTIYWEYVHKVRNKLEKENKEDKKI